MRVAEPVDAVISPAAPVVPAVPATQPVDTNGTGTTGGQGTRGRLSPVAVTSPANRTAAQPVGAARALPFTGSNTGTETTLGLLAVLFGAIVVRLGRRRTAADRD